jgi:hypothetical protein
MAHFRGRTRAFRSSFLDSKWNSTQYRIVCAFALQKKYENPTGNPRQWAYTETAMEKLKAFQDLARSNGYVDAEETNDGTVLWLKKPTADAEDRMCVDSLTNSVTVFWATMPWKINSKTFRVVSDLQGWLAQRPVNTLAPLKVDTRSATR